MSLNDGIVHATLKALENAANEDRDRRLRQVLLQYKRATLSTDEALAAIRIILRR